MEAFLLEKATVKSVVDPQSISSAVVGNRVDMKNAKRVSFIVSVGTSTSATAVTFTLEQANAASSGTKKVLSVANKYFYKANTDTVFTKVEPASAASAYDFTSIIGDHVGYVVLEVLAEDLDVENNFEWVSIDVTAAGVTKQCSIIAIVDSEFRPPYGIAV